MKYTFPKIEKVPEMNPDFLSFEEVLRIVTEEMNKAIREVEAFEPSTLADEEIEEILCYLQGKADALVMIASKLIAKPLELK
jgi:hypothetical protein